MDSPVKASLFKKEKNNYAAHIPAAVSKRRQQDACSLPATRHGAKNAHASQATTQFFKDIIHPTGCQAFFEAYAKRSDTGKLGSEYFAIKIYLFSVITTLPFRGRDIIDNKKIILEKGPRRVMLTYDRSCNLSCPSCRSKVRMANDETFRKLDCRMEKELTPLMQDMKEIQLSLNVCDTKNPLYGAFNLELEKTKKFYKAMCENRIEIENSGMTVPKILSTIM